MVAGHNPSLQNLVVYASCATPLVGTVITIPHQVAVGERQGSKKTTTMATEHIATKFVRWEVPALDTLRESKVYQLRLRLNEGKRLSRDEKNWLTENLMHNSYFKKSIPLMGWRFSFEDVVHRYFVRQDGYEYTTYAIDKTALCSVLDGPIDEIVELPMI